MSSKALATILLVSCHLAAGALAAQVDPNNPGGSQAPINQTSPPSAQLGPDTNSPGGSQIKVVDPNNPGGSQVSVVDPNNPGGSQLKIAYLVGINDYDPDVTGFPGLNYPIKDATELEKALRHQGYNVVRIQDGEATASRIRSDLKNYAKGLAGSDGDGSFLFYFSGHGYAVGGKNYLATYGTQASALDSEGLAVSEIDDLLSSINVRERAALIDACRDEQQGTKGVAPVAQSIAPFKPSGKTAFLFSTQKGQVSREDKDLGHGVFTYYLLEGLQGGAAKGGLITWGDLTSDLSLNSGKFQIPYDAQGSSVDFVIAKVHRDLALAALPVSPANVAPLYLSNRITQITDFGASPISAPSQATLHVTAVSPNGQLVAFANGGSVAVRNVSDGSTVADLSGPSKPIRTLEFSPDSRLVAASAEDQSLWFWDIASSTGWQLQDRGLRLVNAISFSADRLLLATASSDRAVRIWNLDQREVIARSPEPTGVAGIVFLPVPKTTTVAFFGNGASVRVWNWTPQQPGADFSAPARVRSLAFSPDGESLAVGLENGSIEIKELFSSARPIVLTGHEEPVDFVAFSRDGTRLVSNSSDRTFRSWNIQAAQETRSTETKPGMQVVSLSFAADGRLFALALRAGHLELWGVPSP